MQVDDGRRDCYLVGDDLTEVHTCDVSAVLSGGAKLIGFHGESVIRPAVRRSVHLNLHICDIRVSFLQFRVDAPEWFPIDQIVLNFNFIRICGTL